jgi:acetylornithine deacetylase
MNDLYRDGCLKELQAMVRCDTVNGRISGRADAEIELALRLERRAEELGFQARRLPVSGRSFNLLVSHEAKAGAPWILFESHLDTVSADGMTIEPFAARFEGGRIWGRGACDTKGSGAAMLWALKRYADHGRGEVNGAILYSLDEEIGKDGIRAFVERHASAVGFRPIGAVVGEPTRLRPVVAHTGVQRWQIRTRGVAAHSSDPSRGKSAISAMVKVIEALEGRYIPQLKASHPMTGKAQASINVIRGGTQQNIIPESCEITIDRRVVPGEDPAAIQPAVEAVLDALRREHPGLEVEQGPAWSSPPLDPAAGAAFAPIVQRALGALGLPAGLEGVLYCTDACDLAAAGIPAVVLGPGDIAQAHTKDEWLEAAQLFGALDVYQAVLESAAG